MSIFTLIYNHSPIFFQNILISIYGLYLYKIRHGKKYSMYCNNLLKSQFYSEQDLKSMQNSLLEDLIRQSIDYVPYYKNLNIDPQRISEITINNYVDYFPIINKQLLRQRTTDFVSSNSRKLFTRTINTSGTSGTPLNISVHNSNLKKNYAFFNRQLRWAGVSPKERSVTFAGRLIIPPKQKTPPFWRYNLFSNNLLFSSYHLSNDTIPFYLRKLEEYQPVYIDSYPSAVYTLAKYILDNNISLDTNIKSIITSSETLTAIQRDTIETAFRTKVYDHFGNAEMAALITQCEKGSYHLNPEYGLLEIVDEFGHPTPIGQPGRMICTGLINDTMPLIRYDIGDTSAFSTEPCSCGRHFPVIKEIIGRTDDLIITPDGRHVGRLDPIFKGFDSSIVETQIIQESIDRISINIVKSPNYDPELDHKIKSALAKRVGDKISININTVDKIPRTKSGKFRSVISYVNK